MLSARLWAPWGQEPSMPVSPAASTGLHTAGLQSIYVDSKCIWQWVPMWLFFSLPYIAQRQEGKSHLREINDHGKLWPRNIKTPYHLSLAAFPTWLSVISSSAETCVLQRRGSGLHSRGVAQTESCSEGTVPGCDAGDLQQPCLRG